MSYEFSEKSHRTALTLSATVDLISATVSKVVGNDVSTTINGERVTDTMVETIAATRIISNFTKK